MVEVLIHILLATNYPLYMEFQFKSVDILRDNIISFTSFNPVDLSMKSRSDNLEISDLTASHFVLSISLHFALDWLMC